MSNKRVDHYASRLLAVMRGVERFVDPFARDFALASTIERLSNLECVFASDILPKSRDVCCRQPTEVDYSMFLTDAFITRPHANGSDVIEFIEYGTRFAPVWVLMMNEWREAKPGRRVQHMLTDIVGTDDGWSWFRYDLQRPHKSIRTLHAPSGAVEVA